MRQNVCVRGPAFWTGRNTSLFVSHEYLNYPESGKKGWILFLSSRNFLFDRCTNLSVSLTRHIRENNENLSSVSHPHEFFHWVSWVSKIYHCMGAVKWWRVRNKGKVLSSAPKSCRSSSSLVRKSGWTPKNAIKSFFPFSLTRPFLARTQSHICSDTHAFIEPEVTLALFQPSLILSGCYA